MVLVLVIQLLILAVLTYGIITLKKFKWPGIQEQNNVAELNSDCKSIKTWIGLAEKHQKNGHPEILESAFLRYPSSIELFEKIVSYYLPLASTGENLMVRRAAISNLSNHLALFAKYCSPDAYIDIAIKTKKTLEKLTSEVIALLETRQKEYFEISITELEEQFAKYVKLGKDERCLESIAKLDESISKDALKEYTDLSKRYQKISKKLISYFQKETVSTEDVGNYNMRAIELAKSAWELIKSNKAGWFADDSNNFNQEENMMKLVENLGGWDPHKLHPATNTYISSVYAEIFQKLKPESRAMFTELMVREPKK